MRRDPHTGLVQNEKLVLAALLELGAGPIHPYSLTQHWKQHPKERSLPYSTLYRCLNTLQDLGFVTSTVDNTDSGGPARRQYQLTSHGQTLAIQVSHDLQNRLGIPNTPRPSA